MIERIFEFRIDEKTSIELTLSESEEEVYWSDEVEVFYRSREEKILLFSDNILEFIECFNSTLNKLLNNQLQLNDKMTSKGIGYCFNEYTYNLATEEDAEDNFNFDETSKYSLWSVKGVGTWMYNKNNLCFIEISPIYKYHYEDQNEVIYHESYSEFIKGYSAIKEISLDNEIIKEWKEKCEKIQEIIIL